MLLRTALIGLAALALTACQSTPAEQAVLQTDAQAEPQATTLPPRLTVLPDSAVPLTIADAEAALSGHLVDGTTARGSYYITRYNPDGTGTVVLEDGEAYPIFWRIDGGLFCTTYATEECGSVYLVDGWYVIAANGTVLAHQRVIDGATLPDWALAGLN
ncbi:MAG: hypothetical protein H6843_13500 [Rhodospirillaceae bacterium]|nr:hypothetical protein [Rhodospirillaceae bacterium]